MGVSVIRGKYKSCTNKRFTDESIGGVHHLYLISLLCLCHLSTLLLSGKAQTPTHMHM